MSVPTPYMARWRGPWESGDSYEPYDAVMHLGVVFVAEHRNENCEPGDSAMWRRVPNAPDEPMFREPQLDPTLVEVCDPIDNSYDPRLLNAIAIALSLTAIALAAVALIVGVN